MANIDAIIVADAYFWNTLSPLLAATRHDGTFIKPAAMPAMLVLIGVKKPGDVNISVTPAQIVLTGAAECMGGVSIVAGSIAAAASLSGVWRLRLIAPVPAAITLSGDAGGINLPLAAPAAVITAGAAVQSLTLPVPSPPGEIAALGGVVAIWRLAGIIGAVPAGAVSLQAAIIGAEFMMQPAAAQVAITGGVSALRTRLLLVPVQVQVAPGVLTVKMFLIPASRQARYECRLSGNGLPVMVVPMSSFTSRQRSGDPSFSEVTTPTLAQYFDICDRSGGRFSIYIVLIGADKAILQRELLFESSLESISISTSDERQQVVISGYRTEQINLSPQTIPISGVSYRSMYMGKIRLRLYKPILYLRPGDTVIYDLDPIVAGLITYTMSAEFGTTVEISEAP
jgi:hypothetical protein